MSSLTDYVFHQFRPIFFSGDAEKTHEKVLSWVEIVSKFPGVIPFLRWKFQEESPALCTRIFGKKI